jgi:hypothetical protein
MPFLFTESKFKIDSLRKLQIKGKFQTWFVPYHLKPAINALDSSIYIPLLHGAYDPKKGKLRSVSPNLLKVSPKIQQSKLIDNSFSQMNNIFNDSFNSEKEFDELMFPTTYWANKNNLLICYKGLKDFMSYNISNSTQKIIYVKIPFIDFKDYKISHKGLFNSVKNYKLLNEIIERP